MPSRIAAWMTTAMAAFAIACSSGTSAPESSTAPAAPPTPAPPTAAERVAWYQECWRLYNTGTWEPFGACYATGAESENVVGTEAMTDAVIAAL